MRIVRTPRTVQAVAHLHSSCRGWLRLFQPTSGPFGRSPLGRGQPRIHGPGTEARVLYCPTSGLGLSYRNRSRQELRPNPIDPDTSCRKHVTSQAGEPAPPDLDVSEEIHVFRACPTTAADAAFASQGRFGCRPAKSRHIPLNPRCLPLPDVPRPGPSPPIPQSVPSLWSERAGAFSIFVRPVP